MWARAGPPKSHLLVSRERPPRFANKGRNHRPAYPQKIAANLFLCVGCLQHVRPREPPQFPGASALKTGPPCRRLLCKGVPCRNEKLFGAHVRLSRPLRGFAIKYARGLAVRDEIWSLSSLDSQGQNPVNVAGPPQPTRSALADGPVLRPSLHVLPFLLSPSQPGGCGGWGPSLPLAALG